MARSRITLSDDQLNALEAHLAGTLRRVTPPMEVATRLRERIRFPEPGTIVLRFQDWRRMFLVLGGVMSGMVALLTLARALYYFVARKQI